MEALWVAKTGLDAQQTRMTVVSNNLANVNTTGFKKSRVIFEDLLYQNVSQVGGATSQDTEQPTGLNLGTGVRVVATEKSFNQGTTVNTGNPFDVMVSGRGFFQVLLPDGGQAYTRDGSFKIDSEGRLVTASGLQPRGQNLLIETAASGTPQLGNPALEGRGELVQGALEGSNVNVVEELVGMIETQRAYEMASKAISTSEQMLQYLNNNL